MKSDKFERFVSFYVIVFSVMWIVLTFAFSVYGVRFSGSVAHAIEPEISTEETSKPRIVLYSTPGVLSKDNAYQEFIVTARIENVASVNGGLYGAAVRIVPENASSLDFIEFVENKEIPQSALVRGSHHIERIDVLMEGICNEATALTEDFDIGGFKFKLKQGASIPDYITFNYSDKNSADFLGNKVYMSSGSFVINIVDPGDFDEFEQGGSNLPNNSNQPDRDKNTGSNDVANTTNKKGLTIGEIAGIAVGGVSFVGIIIMVILIILKKKKS